MACPISREAGALGGRSDVAIQEIGGADSDTESSGSDANDAIAAAGMQIAQMHTQHGQFIAAVNNLVRAGHHKTVWLGLPLNALGSDCALTWAPHNAWPNQSNAGCTDV